MAFNRAVCLHMYINENYVHVPAGTGDVPVIGSAIGFWQILRSNDPYWYWFYL